MTDGPVRELEKAIFTKYNRLIGRMVSGLTLDQLHILAGPELNSMVLRYLRLKASDMSADNGTLLRKRSNGKFVLQTYFISDDTYPDKEIGGTEHDTLEEALAEYQKQQAGDYPDEYGLNVLL